MKKILFVFFLIISCNQEKNFETISIDSTSVELREIIDLSSKNLSLSDTIQKRADQKTSETIDKAVETITSLKEENKSLKKELNEVTKKLDAVTNPDNGVQFKLLPISNSKENR